MLSQIFGFGSGKSEPAVVTNTNGVQAEKEPSEKIYFHQYIQGGKELEFRNDEEGGGNHFLTVNLHSDITIRDFQKLIKEAAKFQFKSRDIEISCAGGEVTKPLLKDNVEFVNYVGQHRYFWIRIRDYFHKYTIGGQELEFRVTEHSRHNEYVTVNLNSEITTRDFQKLIKSVAKEKLHCNSK